MKVKIGENKDLAKTAVVDSSALPAKTDAKALAKAVQSELPADISLEDLELVLKKEFPPRKIKELLIDMTKAQDTKSTPMGDFYETPNWDVRHKALQSILRLLGHIKNDQGAVPESTPTKIVFNVIHKQVNVQNAEVHNDSKGD